LCLCLLLSSGVGACCSARALSRPCNKTINAAATTTTTTNVATRAVWIVWRNENWIRYIPSPLPPSTVLHLRPVAFRFGFGLVWLVYCGRLAGGVGQAGDTMEPPVPASPCAVGSKCVCTKTTRNYGFWQT